MSDSVLEPDAAEGSARCRPQLGTYVEIRIAQPSAVAADAGFEAISDIAFDAAFEAIAQCEKLMNFHDCTSELSRINRAGAGEVIDVHPWTAQVLRYAIELFDLTDGVFDAGVAAQLVGWGLLPSPSAIYAGRNASLADIECDSGKVHVLRRTCIDLGGIAKGFAVDRATDALRERGVKNAIINAGGDLRVLGDMPHPVHVRHPGAPSSLVCIGELAEGALATSSPYFSRQRIGVSDTEVCALVDSRSREPLTEPRSYTVIAPECWAADALTKVLAAGIPPEARCFSHYCAQAIILQG
jgi:thiamine biosynthesis lipoprotein